MRVESLQDLDEKMIERRLHYLNDEIRVLEQRVKMHDTGHIKTTISTLKARIREIERRRDGQKDWYDEYLIGY